MQALLLVSLASLTKLIALFGFGITYKTKQLRKQQKTTLALRKVAWFFTVS